MTIDDSPRTDFIDEGGVWVGSGVLITLWLSYVDSYYALRWLIRPRYKTTKDGIFDGAKWFIPWDDYYHYPNQVRKWENWHVPKPLSRKVNGSAKWKVPHPRYQSPDFRTEDPPVSAAWYKYVENGRYYRLSPGLIHNWRYWKKWDRPQMLNCYCVTVYKRYTPLGMGAVLTLRNILTTAMSTDIIVRRYRQKKTLQNILGAWYNTDLVWTRYTNTSYYATPAKIAYHPKWRGTAAINRSHPLPCVYDLALWTTTKSMYYDFVNWPFIYIGYHYYGYITALCQRWATHRRAQMPPIMTRNKYGSREYIIVGCQMVMDIGRRPFPWFRYGYRHSDHHIPTCPKSEWGWFHCTNCGGPQMRLGAEPGAALHMMPWFDWWWPWNTNWRYYGLAGINSMAMKLRSRRFVNYFTVLDRHPVLDWLHDSMKGYSEYAWIDCRFTQVAGRGIVPKTVGGQFINAGWKHPDEWYWKRVAFWAQGYYDPIWY